MRSNSSPSTGSKRDPWRTSTFDAIECGIEARDSHARADRFVATTREACGTNTRPGFRTHTQVQGGFDRSSEALPSREKSLPHRILQNVVRANGFSCHVFTQVR